MWVLPKYFVIAGKVVSEKYELCWISRN